MRFIIVMIALFKKLSINFCQISDFNLRDKQISSEVAYFILHIAFFMTRIGVTEDWLKPVVSGVPKQCLCRNRFTVLILLAYSSCCHLIKPYSGRYLTDVLKYDSKAFKQRLSGLRTGYLAVPCITIWESENKLMRFSGLSVFRDVYLSKIYLGFASGMLKIDEALIITVDTTFIFLHDCSHSST